MRYSLPATLLWPLASNQDLRDAIGAVSGESPDTVSQRLLAEEQCLGINVRREVQELNLEPHIWSDRLDEFYRTTKSFLYETSVWNRNPVKQRCREWIGQYLAAWQKSRKTDEPLRILCYGDGLGFDSTFLSLAGHSVAYFEVSQECRAFAGRVFSRNGTQPCVVESLEMLACNSFDAILCLDVLEHVPHPPDVIALFASWLKPGGRLITHSPFWLVAPYYSTHLRSNRIYSGSLQLFRRHGLHPVGGTFFWNPIILERTVEAGNVNARPGSLPLPMKVGGLLLYGARWESRLYCWLARLFSRSDPQWRNELARDVADRKKKNGQNGLDPVL